MDFVNNQIPQGQSEFNSSLQKIIMLDKLQGLTHQCLIAGDLISAYNSLLQIEIELDYRLTDNDIKNLDKIKVSIESMLADAVNNEFQKTMWRGIDPRSSKPSLVRNNKKFQDTKLMLIGYFKQLMRYKQAAGLGVKEKSDPRAAIIE